MIMFKKPEVNIGEPDMLISRNEVIMLISNYQQSTSPYSEEGKIQYDILESLFAAVKDMQGIPINQREEFPIAVTKARFPEKE